MDEEKNINLKLHNFDDVMKEQQPCSSSSTISNGSSSTTTTTTSSLSCSSCSSYEDTRDDASSSSSRSSLYDLTDLMSHLPIKRGLSKFYHGKSDSFTSLARVTSIEDLPKKDNNPHNKKKMKKSYKSHTLPKPLISKKNSRKKKFGSSIKKEL